MQSKYYGSLEFESALKGSPMRQLTQKRESHLVPKLVTTLEYMHQGQINQD